MPPVRMKTRKLWLGVGVAALVSAGPAALDFANAGSATATSDQASATKLQTLAEAASDTGDHMHAGHGDTAKPAAQGGEGGEGGESGGSSLPTNVKFLRDVGLIRGHLLVGNELVEQGHWADAQPHFLHPVEEIYEAIRRPLKEKHISDFDGALKALAQTVKAKKLEAYKQAWARVDARLVEIESAEKSAAGSAWPSTTVATVLALIQSAAGEYSEAVEEGRIAKPIEYQDSRGFVFYGAKLLDSVSAELKVVDGDALTQIKSVYSQLQYAWPTAVPPAKPVLDQAAVLAAISRFELAAGPFLNR